MNESKDKPASRTDLLFSGECAKDRSSGYISFVMKETLIAVTSPLSKRIPFP